MGTAIPDAFDDEFLEWFRGRTEVAWATSPEPTLEYFAERHLIGCAWQPGTRWLGGLTEAQIADVEHSWELPFPPDYRLFLRHLHVVDRPMRCNGWHEPIGAEPPGHRLYDRAAFDNVLTNSTALEDAREDIAHGLLFDVEQNDLWPSSWGLKPTTMEQQAQRVRELVTAAPPIIPVFGHRYLLGEPVQAGNPVLSIWQSDIIVMAPDLRTYLLSEFADILDIDTLQIRETVATKVQGHFGDYAAIPFWGEFLA